MQLNPIQNQPNFKGSFYGIFKNGEALHRYPSKAVSTCPYADRFLLKTVKKIMHSKKYSQDLKITFDESNGMKNLIFDINPKTTKKFLPKILQIFQGNFINLTNPIFWKILKNKKTQTIRYEFPKKDLNSLVDYFYNPHGFYEKLNNLREDGKIFKKTNEFKATLKQHYPENEKQQWLDEFFDIETNQTTPKKKPFGWY